VSSCVRGALLFSIEVFVVCCRVVSFISRCGAETIREGGSKMGVEVVEFMEGVVGVGVAMVAVVVVVVVVGVA
jgi:hypothetical protein